MFPVVNNISYKLTEKWTKLNCQQHLFLSSCSKSLPQLPLFEWRHMSGLGQQHVHLSVCRRLWRHKLWEGSDTTHRWRTWYDSNMTSFFKAVTFPCELSCFCTTLCVCDVFVCLCGCKTKHGNILVSNTEKLTFS